MAGAEESQTEEVQDGGSSRGETDGGHEDGMSGAEGNPRNGPGECRGSDGAAVMARSRLETAGCDPAHAESGGNQSSLKGL